MLHVENMTATDFPFAVELSNTMYWNMTQEDFKFNLTLEPEGCFLLFDKLDRAGIATCVSFGKVGWFGNLVVDKDHRNKGGGTLLVQRACSYLENKGVETIGLYAYQHLVRFYEDMGFKANEEFSVFQGKPKTQRFQGKLERITGKDAHLVFEFDKQCFQGDREKLLAYIILNENNQCYLSKQNGGITGYVAAKRYERITEIGPLVCRCDRSHVAKSLLKAVMDYSPSQEIFVCLPSRNRSLIGVLSDAGLQESFRVTRMFLGSTIAESCTYVAESLERG